MSLKGKKIVLGITGSIAAYKTPHLVRLLVKTGAEVRVITTSAANDFVSPLSLSTVSKNKVLTEFNEDNTWNNHVELGLWADAIIIAPCSANTLAKFANGLCDNLLCAVYLSARCPVFVAPAMDEDMWQHQSVQGNVNKLKGFGNIVLQVENGELASGLIGAGRMAEPEKIIDYLTEYFSETAKPLKGIKALVTAGPTFERIDPVRFIGNFSTGKMGIAIAEALAAKGAIVTLVLGPSQEKVGDNISIIRVQSAEEMYDACIKEFTSAKIAVLAAAVADYTPVSYSAEKIKKIVADLEISFTKTKDILLSLGKIKQAGQTLVGFALETTNELENAQKKLINKNADMIVLNSLNDEGAGFGHNTNKITMMLRNGNTKALPLQTKKEAAEAIVNQIIELKYANKTLL